MQNKESEINGVNMLRDSLRTHYLTLAESLFFGGNKEGYKKVEYFLERIDIERDSCIDKIKKQIIKE